MRYGQPRAELREESFVLCHVRSLRTNQFSRPIQDRGLRANRLKHVQRILSTLLVCPLPWANNHQAISFPCSSNFYRNQECPIGRFECAQVVPMRYVGVFNPMLIWFKGKPPRADSRSIWDDLLPRSSST